MDARPFLKQPGPMRFCPCCRRVLNHDDDTPYCYREACVAKRTGLWSEARDPDAKPAFVKVTGQPKRKRIKYAKPKHAARSRQVEPKHEPVPPRTSHLLANKLPVEVLEGLLQMKTEMERSNG